MFSEISISNTNTRIKVWPRYQQKSVYYLLCCTATSLRFSSFRSQFDEGKIVEFTDEDLLDIHTITSVLKLYFRELPNPLLTYQLYEPLIVSHSSKLYTYPLYKPLIVSHSYKLYTYPLYEPLIVSHSYEL